MPPEEPLHGPERAAVQDSSARLAEQLQRERMLIEQSAKLQHECMRAAVAAKRICAKSRRLRQARVPDGFPRLSSDPSASASQRRESAGDRRSKELSQLAQEGFPIVRAGKWQFRAGSVIVWPYSGRWMNEATGSRGKLNSLPMRRLIVRETASATAANAVTPRA